jgi:hypothetical protein
MTGTKRSRVRVLTFVTTILTLTALSLVLAPATLASSESSGRSGELHVTKECSQYTGLAGSFCTITSSNLKAIKAGSRVVYAQAADPVTNELVSDITLVVNPGNRAFGHVILTADEPWIVTLDGGTGKFKNFHAWAVVSVVVQPDLSEIWYWDGWYRFSEKDD